MWQSDREWRTALPSSTEQDRGCQLQLCSKKETGWYSWYFGVQNSIASPLGHYSYHCRISNYMCSENQRYWCCALALSNEGLVWWRFLPSDHCMVAGSHQLFAKLRKPSFWRLGAYHKPLFFHFTCKPRHVFGPLSSSWCDQRWGLSFCVHQELLIQLNRAITLKRHSTLCNRSHCLISICTSFQGHHDRFPHLCVQCTVYLP